MTGRFGRLADALGRRSGERMAREPRPSWSRIDAELEPLEAVVGRELVDGYRSPLHY